MFYTTAQQFVGRLQRNTALCQLHFNRTFPAK